MCTDAEPARGDPSSRLQGLIEVLYEFWNTVQQMFISLFDISLNENCGGSDPHSYEMLRRICLDAH